jgi:hypothetical protein
VPHTRTLRRVLLLILSLAAPAYPQARTCGVERWNVKIINDLDAALVVREAVASTINALISIPGEPAPPENGRTPLERRVFRVRGIILESRPVQADGDIHLVIGDPADRTRFLVAEIPDSACALGSRYATQFAEARRKVATLPQGTEVEVEGVAFWDDDHGQLGAAPNNIELHPLLSIVPVLGSSDISRLESNETPVDGQEVRVWLNVTSKVYHCPQSRFYGKTKQGVYMTEAAAVRAGAKPAGGRSCR